MSRTLEITRPEAPTRRAPARARGNGRGPEPVAPDRPRRRWGLALLVGLLLAGAATVFLLARSEDSPPPDRAAEFVRSSAVAYVHVSSDTGGEQWRRTSALMEDLPLLQELRDRLLTAPLRGADFERDIRPWLGGEAAFALVPFADRDPQPLLVFESRDDAAAERALNRRSAGATVPYRGNRIHTVGRDAAAALRDGFVVAGAPGVVRRALDVRAGATPSLAGNDAYTKLRDDLPADRLVHGWLARPMLKGELAGPAAVLAGAARAEGIEAGAFSFGVEGERTRLAFRGEASKDSRRPSGCEGSASGDSLLSKGPSAPTALVGLDGVQCLVRDVMAAPATAGGLREFLTQVEERDQVSVEKELLPLLKGETEVVLSEGAGDAPLISAAVTDVDGRKALDVLGRLQPALLRLVDPEASGSSAAFSSREIAGEPALTAAVSPALELSYAALDDTLVASTAPKGIEDAKNGKGPGESGDFEAVLGDRPENPSAVIFIDLDKLLALGDRVGLAEVPAYLAVRDDLQKLGALGAVVSREEEAIKADILSRTP